MDTKQIKDILNNAIQIKQEILNDNAFISNISQSINIIVETYKNNGKVLLCGNGGSASDCQHIAAELSGRFYYDRPPLYAQALHVNTSYLTAVANDYSYDIIFQRMIQASGNKGDILFGLSTSGNSKNVVLAMQQAQQLGMTTIGFTSQNGGLLSSCSNILFKVPSNDTPRIQEIHIMLGHIICQGVEAELFPRKN